MKLWLSLLGVALLAGAVSAQPVTYSAEVESGLVGGQVQVSVRIANTIGINGWTIALCQDPNFATVDSIANGPLLNSLVPPVFTAPFITTRVFPGDPADPVDDPGGITVAVVANLLNPSATIPTSSTGAVCVNVTYNLIAPTNTLTPPVLPLEFCNGVLQFGASDPVSNTYTFPGSPPVPPVATGVDGSIEIGTLPPLQLQIDTVTGAPGATVDVPVILSNTIEFEGFSFGIEHDDTLATLIEIVEGTDLAATNGGAGADLFFTDSDVPGSVGGGVVVSATSLEAPFETTPIAPMGATLVIFRYEINPAAPDGSAIDLDFMSDLGIVAVPVLFSVDGEDEIPTLASGQIMVSGAPVGNSDFIRGDVNADGVVNNLDVSVASAQVSGSQPTPCSDALDANDDGVIDANDPAAIANVVFAMGAPLPAPSVCGPDPTMDALDCSTFAFCP